MKEIKVGDIDAQVKEIQNKLIHNAWVNALQCWNDEIVEAIRSQIPENFRPSGDMVIGYLNRLVVEKPKPIPEPKKRRKNIKLRNDMMNILNISIESEIVAETNRMYELGSKHFNVLNKEVERLISNGDCVSLVYNNNIPEKYMAELGCGLMNSTQIHVDSILSCFIFFTPDDNYRFIRLTKEELGVILSGDKDKGELV